MGVGGQRHAPAALPPGKTRYPLYTRLGGPQGRSEQLRKISPPTRIRFPDRPARNNSLYRMSYPATADQYREVHFSEPSSLVILLVSKVHKVAANATST